MLYWLLIMVQRVVKAFGFDIKVPEEFLGAVRGLEQLPTMPKTRSDTQLFNEEFLPGNTSEAPE